VEAVDREFTRSCVADTADTLLGVWRLLAHLV
jgi:hypothetical protein